MKLEFRGWRRQTTVHEHAVRPVLYKSRAFVIQPPGAIAWPEAYHARGRISGVALSGDFMVDVKFDPEDFKEGLARLVHEDPRSALRLMAQLQAEAMIALAKAPA